ncbi:MAG TPA: hypothetical protein DGG94_03370 [Micromonosporaceae bacterium]|nr:hypothetical protein [Micromonosporaceae bacterium]
MPWAAPVIAATGVVMRDTLNGLRMRGRRLSSNGEDALRRILGRGLAGLGVCAAALTLATASTAAAGGSAVPVFERRNIDLPLVSGGQVASAENQATATATAAAASAPSPTAAVNSISYLTRRYQITPAEAERRLKLQVESVALAAQLAQQHPDDYAGMWLDQAGGGVLKVSMVRPELVPTRPGVVAVTAKWSLRQLESEARRLSAAEPGAEVYVDQPSNQVTVRRGNPGFELKCDPLHCGEAPIRGGIRIDVPRVNGTVGGCSVGYRVRSAVSGKEFLLTAGHCVLGSTHAHQDFTWHEYLGPRTPVTIEDPDIRLTENGPDPGHDYAIMPYQAGASGFWLGGGTVNRRSPLLPHMVNHHDLRITGYTPMAQVQVGWVVCASGSGYTPEPGESYVDSGAGRGYIPGTHCGEVKGKAAMIDVEICARKGDSGGPLFTEADGKALGILSGGDSRSGPCVAGDTERNRYASISTILERVNARTNGEYQFELVPQPTPQSPTPRRG